MSDDPKEILRQSYWESLRRRLDDLGAQMHRLEDAQTRLAFVRLVEAVQAYEDSKRL